MQKHFFLFILLAVLGLSSACSFTGIKSSISEAKSSILSFWEPQSPPRPPLIEAGYQAGTSLANLLDQTSVGDTHILVTTFADLDDLERSSSLGRLLPQQIASVLRERGYLLVDVRLRSQDLLIQKKNGEFILSRDIEVLEPGLRSALFLLGTYSQIQNTVYVNAKVVSSKDGVVLAATDFTVPKAFLGSISHGKKEDSLRLRPSVRTSRVDPVTEKPLPE